VRQHGFEHYTAADDTAQATAQHQSVRQHGFEHCTAADSISKCATAAALHQSVRQRGFDNNFINTEVLFNTRRSCCQKRATARFSVVHAHLAMCMCSIVVKQLYYYACGAVCVHVVPCVYVLI
jgi:hypothetical protein